MIARTPSLTYASELLVEMRDGEKRAWVREAYAAFWLHIAESCILSLQTSALAFGKETVREWAFHEADAWLTHTSAGRDFADRVATETRA